MVGRGPQQQVLPYPNNSGSNVPSNEMVSHTHHHSHLTITTPSFPTQPNKMMPYTIQHIPIKQEVNQVERMLADNITNSKFPEFVMGTSVYPQSVPQYPGDNNFIHMNPVELPSNDPYKLLEGTNEGPLLFQKYPVQPSMPAADNSLWPSNDLSNLPLPSHKDANLYAKDQDDDFLAQLFDVGGLLEDLGNDMLTTPTNDVLIPMQFPPDHSSPPASNNVSPIHSNQIQFDGAEFNWSPMGTMGEGGQNSRVSVPSEEMYIPDNDITANGKDDLQEILGDILGGRDYPTTTTTLTNSLGTTSDINYIPNRSLSPVTPSDELTNNSPQSIAPEELLIPSVDAPPPSKKPRGSYSSVHSMDTGSPLDKLEVPSSYLSHHDQIDSSPLQSPAEASLDGDHTHKSSSKHNTAVGGPTLLFGQHEDAIIKKLHPQLTQGSKPIKRDKLVTMPVEEFNSLLDQANLTEIEVAFMKEWRRRGKNKMAAQIARKRKRDELSELQEEIDSLKQQRTQLEQRARSLKHAVTSLKKKAEVAEGKIYQKYSSTHGTAVSKDTHTIHITDDGKTMLIPRMSSQVLLV